MTSFNSQDIPVGITTIEQLFCWCSAILSDANPTLISYVDGSQTQFSITDYPNQPKAQNAANLAKWFQISVAAIPLEDGWRRYPQPWLAAKQLSTSAIPSELKT